MGDAPAPGPGPGPAPGPAPDGTTEPNITAGAVALRMDVAELNDFFVTAFPDGRPYLVEAVGPHTATLRLPGDQVMIRPGGTVSGPTLMGLADAAAYAVILAHLGPVALAVTSNLNISFLHKPAPTGVRADAEILKLGRKLAVVDVRLFSEGRPELVAQATVTYAIPSSEWGRGT